MWTPYGWQQQISSLPSTMVSPTSRILWMRAVSSHGEKLWDFGGKRLHAAVENQAIMAGSGAVDGLGQVLHPRLAELLPQDLDYASYGFSGAATPPNVVEQLIARNQLIWTACQSLQEPKGQRIAQIACLAAPMNRKGGAINDWVAIQILPGSRREPSGGNGEAECVRRGFAIRGNVINDLFGQLDRLVKTGSKPGQSLNNAAGVIDDGHGI